MGVKNQQDREDSGRDLEPERRQEHEQGELEKEANSVYVGLKVTKSGEQEREDNGRALEPEPRKGLIRRQWIEVRQPDAVGSARGPA